MPTPSCCWSGAALRRELRTSSTHSPAGRLRRQRLELPAADPRRPFGDRGLFVL